MKNSMVRKLVTEIRRLKGACPGARCYNCTHKRTAEIGGVVLQEHYDCAETGRRVEYDFGCIFFKPLDSERLDDSGYVKENVRF